MAQLSNQAVVPHVPRSQMRLARTSVGPVYSAPIVQKHFLHAIRAGIAQHDDRPQGISNRSSFCYRNAVLRMLISSQRFVSYIRTWHLTVEVPAHGDGTLSNQNILGLIADIARAAERQLVSGLPPRRLGQKSVDIAVQNLWSVTCDTQRSSVPEESATYRDVPLEGGKYWNTNRNIDGQHDAHEWLMWLLEAINRQLKTYSNPQNNPQLNFQNLLFTQRSKRWTCNKCLFKVRRRLETSTDDSLQSCLTVNFPDGTHKNPLESLKKPLALQDLVNGAFKQEISDAVCPRCQDKTTTKVGYSTILHTPDVLLVQLQRTAFNEKSAVEKIAQAVSIPEHLDLTSFLDPHAFGGSSVVKYRLSSIVSHIGSDFNSGHYQCYARVGKGYDKWFKFNDALVTPCDLEDFDDTITDIYKTKQQLKNRPTPYLVLYELDYERSRKTRGRQAMNPGVGHKKDSKPSTWYAEDVPRTALPPVVHQAEDEALHHLGSMPGESGSRAEIHVAVQIGDQVFELPRSFIEHFNIHRKRRIEIKASMVAADGGTLKEIDLIDAYNDALADQKERRKYSASTPRLLMPRGDWKGRWKVSKR